MLRARLLSCTALTTLLLAAPSNAGTLTVTTDQPSYQVGDTITLTATGDSQGLSGFQPVYARLALDNPSVADFASGTPIQSMPVFPPPPLVCTPSSCEMFDFIPTTQFSIPIVSTVSFLATAPGSRTPPGTS